MSEMHHGSQDHAVDKPEAAPAATSNDLTAMVSSILGRAPSDYEVDEGIWYDALRTTLRQARADDKTSQGQIAERLKVAQSEVSRLETSVGPGTSLGRVRDYLRACGAQIDMTITTHAGRSLAVGARSSKVLPNLGPPDFEWDALESAVAADTPHDTPAFHAADPGQREAAHQARLRLLGLSDTGRQPDVFGELAALTSSLLALEETMRKENLPPEMAARLRNGVLTAMYRRAREGASATEARPAARGRATAATRAGLRPGRPIATPVAEEAE